MSFPLLLFGGQSQNQSQKHHQLAHTLRPPLVFDPHPRHLPFPFLLHHPTPSIQSISYGTTLTPAEYLAHAKQLVTINKNLHFAEGALRGYFEVEFTKEECNAQFYGM